MRSGAISRRTSRSIARPATAVSAGIRPSVDSDRPVDLPPTLGEGTTFTEPCPPPVLEVGTVDGSSYGIPPRGMQPIALFYNKTMLEQEGQAPSGTDEDPLALAGTGPGPVVRCSGFARLRSRLEGR